MCESFQSITAQQYYKATDGSGSDAAGKSDMLYEAPSGFSLSDRLNVDRAINEPWLHLAKPPAVT